MEPKSIEEVPSWVIVNALRCPVDAQISIVAKLLQHLDGDQRNKALSMSGVGEWIPISSPPKNQDTIVLIDKNNNLSTGYFHGHKSGFIMDSPFIGDPVKWKRV